MADAKQNGTVVLFLCMGARVWIRDLINMCSRYPLQHHSKLSDYDQVHLYWVTRSK